MPKGLRGFQKGHGLIGGGSKGRKHTAEENEKNRLAHLGNKTGFKKGNRWGVANKGKKNGLGNKSRTGQKHSPEERLKISLALRGERHPHWRGGSSFEPYSTDWTNTLKRSIRERDKYICRICLGYGDSVHHIDYDKKNCYPTNLITLCRSCNAKANIDREWHEAWYKAILSKRYKYSYKEV